MACRSRTNFCAGWSRKKLHALKRAIGSRKFGIDLFDDRGKIGLIDIKSKFEVYRRHVIADDFNVNPDTSGAIPDQIQLETLVAAQLGLASQVCVELGELRSKIAVVQEIILYRPLK